MVNVTNGRCVRRFCTKAPIFSVNSSTKSAYCGEHAEKSVIATRDRRCSHSSCPIKPSYNVKGSERPMYCKKHAERGMVILHRERCVYDTCTRVRCWGLLTKGSATVCSRHKGEISGGHVINFRLECKAADCRTFSRWGPSGEQPTHCNTHGPFQDGFVHCVAMSAGKRSRVISDCGKSSPPYRVKTECSF